jgi:hypothetical protein
MEMVLLVRKPLHVAAFAVKMTEEVDLVRLFACKQSIQIKKPGW